MIDDIFYHAATLITLLSLFILGPALGRAWTLQSERRQYRTACQRASKSNSTKTAGVIEAIGTEGSMTDQELIVSTLRKAGRIIGEYIEPGPRDPDETIAQLIAVLDNQDVARAIDRLEKGHGLRVEK